MRGSGAVLSIGQRGLSDDALSLSLSGALLQLRVLLAERGALCLGVVAGQRSRVERLAALGVSVRARGHGGARPLVALGARRGEVLLALLQRGRQLRQRHRGLLRDARVSRHARQLRQHGVARRLGHRGLLLGSRGRRQSVLRRCLVRRELLRRASHRGPRVGLARGSLSGLCALGGQHRRAGFLGRGGRCGGGSGGECTGLGAIVDGVVARLFGLGTRGRGLGLRLQRRHERRLERGTLHLGRGGLRGGGGAALFSRGQRVAQLAALRVGGGDLLRRQCQQLAQLGRLLRAQRTSLGHGARLGRNVCLRGLVVGQRGLHGRQRVGGGGSLVARLLLGVVGLLHPRQSVLQPLLGRHGARLGCVRALSLALRRGLGRLGADHGVLELALQLLLCSGVGRRRSLRLSNLKALQHVVERALKLCGALLRALAVCQRGLGGGAVELRRCLEQPCRLGQLRHLLQRNRARRLGRRGLRRGPQRGLLELVGARLQTGLLGSARGLRGVGALLGVLRACHSRGLALERVGDEQRRRVHVVLQRAHGSLKLLVLPRRARALGPDDGDFALRRGAARRQQRILLLQRRQRGPQRFGRGLHGRRLLLEQTHLLAQRHAADRGLLGARLGRGQRLRERLLLGRRARLRLGELAHGLGRGRGILARRRGQRVAELRLGGLGGGCGSGLQRGDLLRVLLQQPLRKRADGARMRVLGSGRGGAVRGGVGVV